ncbi:hybrid signal transduction histidine kinase M [Tanacetum coccineum]
MAHFMFTTEEMRLKTRAQAASIDYTSSLPMVLLANSDTSARRYNVATDKVNKPCFNFNKGFCRFGEHCKFLHNGVHGNPSLWSSSNTRSISSSIKPNMTPKQTMALIQSQQALLDKYKHGNMGLNAFGGNMSSGNLASNTHVALHNGPAISYASYNSPLGFHMP